MDETLDRRLGAQILRALWLRPGVPWRPTMRGYLFISLCLASALPTLLFGYSETRRWRAVQNEQADMQHCLAARAVAEQLSMLLSANESAVESVAAELLQQGTMDPARIQPLLDAGRRRRPTLSIFVADSSLTSVAASPALMNGVPAAGRSYRDRAYILDALASRSLSLSGVEVGKVTGTPNLHVALGAWRPDGSLLGVVVAAIDLASIREAALRAAEVVPGLQLIVTDSRGRVVVHPETKKERAMADLSGLPLFAPVNGDEPQVRSGADDDGVPVRAASATMHNQNQRWTVTVFQPQRDLEKEAEDTTRTLAAGALLILFLAVASSALLASWLASPIVRLAAFASQPGRGAELPLPRRSDPSEVVQLLEATGSMMRRLGAHTVELEAKVSARTCELLDANEQLKQEMAERKKIESELLLAQKLEAVGRLAAGLAHEINTPVQFIADSIQFVRDAVGDLFSVLEKLARVKRSVLEGLPSREAALEVTQAEEDADLPYVIENVPLSLERALTGLEQVANLVRSMKVFAHQGKREMTPANLNLVVQSVLTIARHETRFVAEVEADYAELPPVDCIPGDLNQVLLNLVVNAAHAIGEVGKGTTNKGLIRVRTRREGEDAVIFVSDTGTGIPEAIRARIFDPFFTTKEVGKGTGQGLSIAHSIVVKGHRGQLTFETAVGQGTTFYVRLPITQH